MSYCVNCGVELDAELPKCPLCHTPVINPSELKVMERPSSYPHEKGQVEVVKRKDLGILLSVVLGAASVSCALLNLLVFNSSMWSLLIIGICIILFVLAIPAVIYTKLPIYLSLLFDGIAVGGYLYMITYLTPSPDWFWLLALPITALVTLLVEIFTFLIRIFPNSFITTTLYFFAEVAVLCAGIELLIDGLLQKPLGLSWSAVVLTACSIIVIALITLLSKRRLRDEVRRRLHF
ncbi:DUF6320 domain-containing protein [Kineothrix sedimenti]|uniref:DUF6320 domain-containing protein n=1 Tax=Kineothrix sedimenti TaxID=3123317 RepID=A0ABZ3ERD9_9FIRM